VDPSAEPRGSIDREQLESRWIEQRDRCALVRTWKRSPTLTMRAPGIGLTATHPAAPFMSCRPPTWSWQSTVRKSLSVCGTRPKAAPSAETGHGGYRFSRRKARRLVAPLREALPGGAGAEGLGEHARQRAGQLRHRARHLPRHVPAASAREMTMASCNKLSILLCRPEDFNYFPHYFLCN